MLKEMTALENQDLPCTYLAHHKLESINLVIILFHYIYTTTVIVMTFVAE